MLSRPQRPRGYLFVRMVELYVPQRENGGVVGAGGEGSRGHRPTGELSMKDRKRPKAYMCMYTHTQTHTHKRTCASLRTADSLVLRLHMPLLSAEQSACTGQQS